MKMDGYLIVWFALLLTFMAVLLNMEEGSVAVFMMFALVLNAVFSL